MLTGPKAKRRKLEADLGLDVRPATLTSPHLPRPTPLSQEDRQSSTERLQSRRL